MVEMALEALSQTMLFGALDDDVLHELASVSSVKTFDKGEVVVNSGDPGGDLLVVAAGRLKVITRSAEGADLFLAHATMGDSIGELSLFDLEPRSASIEAREKSTVVTVPGDAVRALIRGHPDVAEELLRQQAMMLRRANNQVADLVFLDLPRRVAKYIIERSDRNGRADLGLSQTELAAAVGGVRQSVNSALRGLERRGWITAEGRIVDIHDHAALADYVAPGT